MRPREAQHYGEGFATSEGRVTHRRAELSFTGFERQIELEDGLRERHGASERLTPPSQPSRKAGHRDF